MSVPDEQIIEGPRPPNLDPNATSLWYEEALEARRYWVQCVDELRTRTGVAVTVLVLATTFFGQLATTEHVPISQRPIELAALALFVLSALLFVVVLLPIYKWNFAPRPGFVRRMVSRGESASQVRESLARKIPKRLNLDNPKYGRLQWSFILGLLAFVAEVVCWILGVA